MALDTERVWALQLAHALVHCGLTLRQYAAKHELKVSTLHSRAYRAGLSISKEMRRLRIQRALDLWGASSGMTKESCVLEAGFSSLQGFNRSRKVLEAAGIVFTYPAVPPGQDERIAILLTRADVLADAVEDMGVFRLPANVRRALEGFRERQLMERAS